MMEEQKASTVFLMGILVVLSFIILIYLPTVTREVGLWITWLYNIKHLRSLPSPPARHWIWGHAAEVISVIFSDLMYTVILYNY